MLALVPPIVEGPSAEARFAEAIASALAEPSPTAVADGRLTLRLLASAALAFNKLDDDRACVATLSLRAAIVTACDLDPHLEPLPLVVRDRRLALVNLLEYLDDLLERLVRQGSQRAATLERAVSLLTC